MQSLTKLESALLIAFVGVVSFPLLYLVRHLDNNTLASWRWIFTGQSISAIILYFLLATIVSYLLSKTEFFERHPAFWTFFISFLVCSTLWQEPELLVDSGRYFIQAKEVSSFGILHFFRQWGDGMQAWTDMPLVPLLYGLIFRTLGENRVVFQFFNSLIFSLGALLTLLSSRIIFGKENSLYAGLLLLGMPYLLTQVPLFLVDIHSLFFLSLALYTFLLALHRGGIYNFWATISIVLAMLTKYSIWPMLSILPLLSLTFSSTPWRDRIRNSSFIFLFVALIASLLFITKPDIVMEQISILSNYQRPALLEWQESKVSTFFFQTYPLITIFAGVSIFMAIRTGNLRLLIIAFFTLFFCIQVPRIRYIIPILPMLTIMAAIGLGTLKFQETKRFVCWLCVSFSLVILHTAYQPFFKNSSMKNIQQAGIYLDSLDSDIIEVRTLPQSQSKAPTFITIPQLDLFTQKTIFAPQDWSASVKRPQGYHPLRFIWEIKKPPYYNDLHLAQTLPLPLAIISSTPIDDSDLTNFREGSSKKTLKRFSATSSIFRYKTYVTVIH